MIPCFAHVAAFDSSDLLKTGHANDVVPEMIHTVKFSTASTKKWLSRPYKYTAKALKRYFTLKKSDVTRWTSVWLCA